MSSRQGSELAFGIVLITLGLIFLAQRQQVMPEIDINIGRLWPLFVIILGLGRWFTPRRPGTHWNGLSMVLVGVLFLLNNYHIFRLHESWPLFIVIGGLSLAFGRSCSRQPAGERTQS